MQHAHAGSSSGTAACARPVLGYHLGGCEILQQLGALCFDLGQPEGQELQPTCALRGRGRHRQLHDSDMWSRMLCTSRHACTHAETGKEARKGVLRERVARRKKQEAAVQCRPGPPTALTAHPFDGSVIARPKSKRDMRQLVEVVGLHNLKDGLGGMASEDGLKPVSQPLLISESVATLAAGSEKVQYRDHSPKVHLLNGGWQRQPYAPRLVVFPGADALLQQRHQLAREACKVYEDSLVGFQCLEVVLTHFQGMQKEKLVLTREVDPQDLPPSSTAAQLNRGRVASAIIVKASTRGRGAVVRR